MKICINFSFFSGSFGNEEALKAKKATRKEIFHQPFFMNDDIFRSVYIMGAVHRVGLRQGKREIKENCRRIFIKKIYNLK